MNRFQFIGGQLCGVTASYFMMSQPYSAWLAVMFEGEWWE